MKSQTTSLIIGAGPFGLGLASYFQKRQHDYCLIGKPMAFWQHNMPAGMLLRSNANWYLDPDHEWTIERYFNESDPSISLSEPISRENYLAYMDWFTKRVGLNIVSAHIRELRHEGYHYSATLENGDTIQAKQVILATGFQYFAHFPEKLIALLPEGRYQHSCYAVDMDSYRDKRVLIVGGRQSAFETAALLREAGSAHIHVSYRHDTPSFEEADWSWVETIVEQMADNPAWFRELSAGEQDDYRYKLWAEGRLKIEPWLKERVCRPEVSLHPKTEVVEVDSKPGQPMVVRLSSGEEVIVDEIILATGYQVDIRRMPFLTNSILENVAVKAGFPLLDLSFQSTLLGLYFTSFPAGHSFGPFFGFTVAVRTAAKLIGQSLCEPASKPASSL